MARFLLIALFASIITALLGAQEARAYPVLMEAKTFPSLGDASRDALIAFAPGQICCDMSLFRDSFYFPVIIDLPFDGTYFKRGSGLYYGLDMDRDPSKNVTSLAEKLDDYTFADVKAPRDIGSSALLVQSGDKIIAVGFRSMKTEVGDRAPPLVAFPQFSGNTPRTACVST